MPGGFGLAAKALSGARDKARVVQQQEQDAAREQEQQEFARMALLASLSGQGIVRGEERETISADLPDVGITGQNHQRPATSVDTGIIDPSRYRSLGKAGGQEFYKDRAKEIAAQRAAERQARIDEALKVSTTKKNEADAFRTLNPIAKPVTAEPNEVVMEGGKRVYRPRSKAVGLEAPSPATASTGHYRDMSAVSTLRGQYNGEQTVKDAAQVATAYRKIKAAATNPSAAGDISLIFGYMRMLDPGSTVREGEFATAQNAAGVPDQVQNAYNRALKGERLNPAQRQDFLRQAEGLVGAQRQSLTGIAKRYASIAQRNGMNPADIVYDPFAEEVDSGGQPIKLPYDEY